MQFHKTTAKHLNSSHKMELDEAIVCSDNEGFRHVETLKLIQILQLH